MSQHIGVKKGLQADEAALVKIFEGVDFSSLEPFLAHCPNVELSEGEILLSPRTTHSHMYILLEGALRVHLMTVDDDPISLILPGEIVGELSALDQSPRSAFVVADRPCRLIEIDRDAFWACLRGSQTFSINLLMTVSRRLRGNNTMVVESRELQQQYKRHALIDGLTGIYNRRWFDDMLPRTFLRSRQENTPLSLIMLDVDHFKKFNDTYGHQAGDFVLFALGIVLKAHFRPTDLLARYGGEEFVVILPYTGLEGAVNAAERVREEIMTTLLEMPDGRKLPHVTISLGIAQRGEHHASGPELLEDADKALYRAKHAGRNRYSI